MIELRGYLESVDVTPRDSGLVRVEYTIRHTFSPGAVPDVSQILGKPVRVFFEDETAGCIPMWNWARVTAPEKPAEDPDAAFRKHYGLAAYEPEQPSNLGKSPVRTFLRAAMEASQKKIQEEIYAAFERIQADRQEPISETAAEALAAPHRKFSDCLEFSIYGNTIAAEPDPAAEKPPDPRVVAKELGDKLAAMGYRADEPPEPTAETWRDRPPLF